MNGTAATRVYTLRHTLPLHCALPFFPVSATASRVTGLNAAAGGLLNNLRVKGDFAYAAGKLISDNLKIDSDRVDATAIVLADMDNAVYRGALKGRVHDYRIDGVGKIGRAHV